MVTGHFGQDPLRPEKARTFRPKKMVVSAKKDGRFGQIIRFTSFTKSVIISWGNKPKACPLF